MPLQIERQFLLYCLVLEMIISEIRFGLSGSYFCLYAFCPLPPNALVFKLWSLSFELNLNLNLSLGFRLSVFAPYSLLFLLWSLSFELNLNLNLSLYFCLKKIWIGVPEKLKFSRNLFSINRL